MRGPDLTNQPLKPEPLYLKSKLKKKRKTNLGNNNMQLKLSGSNVVVLQHLFHSESAGHLSGSMRIAQPKQHR